MSGSRWLVEGIGWLGAFYLHLVGKTSFVQKWDDPAYLELRRLKRPVIYAFWHNAQVFLAYAHRGEPVGVIVSQSKDGEYIAQVMKRMKLAAVRGSTTRGGEGAMREMLKRLERGLQVAFTPDGPRGPVQTVHGGVIEAARLSGFPIVPTAVSSRWKIIFRKSWDRFFVPLPFSHIVVAHGKPLYLSKETSLDQGKDKLRDALNALVASSQAAEREAPSWTVSLAGQILYFVYSSLASFLMPLWLPFIVFRYGFRRSLSHFGERLGLNSPVVSPEPRLWFHAASIGEWQALKPLLAEMGPSAQASLIVTTSTPEARALIGRQAPQLAVRLLTLDLPWILGRWIRRVAPHALIIVETELWPRIIHEAYKMNIPVFIVNGRLSEKSARSWRWFSPLSRMLMLEISHFFVRSQVDAMRFTSIGAPYDKVQVAGNLKYDNIAITAKEARLKKRRELLKDNERVLIIGGSTWPGEEDILLRLFDQQNGGSARLILAPRRPERVAEVASRLKTTGHPWSYWSDIKRGKEWTSDILLVDTMGDLSSLYRASDIAFVGGSLYPHGGQNPLEPAAAGLPVLFGPSMGNFQEEAQALKKTGGALQANTAGELLSEISRLLSEPDRRAAMGQAAAQCVLKQQGTARATAQGLKEKLGF